MPTRALILTARHDRSAEILATSVRERGATAEVVDAVDLGGTAAKAIAERVAPARGGAAGAGAVLATRLSPVRRAGSKLAAQLVGGRLEAFLREHPADVIVSTSPLTIELLGQLRQAGTLATPVVSAITDLAALRHRAHQGVDLHLVAHPESAAEIRELAGPHTQITAVHGLIDPGFVEPPERTAARAELELPARGSLVVVSGAGWSAGELQGAVETALHYTADTIVVLTGDDQRAASALQAAFGEEERVQIHGFADKPVALLAAADVLIHSAAGSIVLEALMCDCRVIAYGRSGGRARINNKAYEELGMVVQARDRTELAHALVAAMNAPPLDHPVADLPQAADLVLALAEQQP